MKKRKYFTKKLPKKKIYQIILTNKGRKIKQLCSDKTEQAIMKKFNTLLKENKKEIAFPKKWIVQEHEMFPSEYEIVILKVKDENDKEVSQIRDEYGRFTNYSTNNKDWVVIDRAEYDIEETFWVYGYHPRHQRKDFRWIMENFIDKDAKTKTTFKSIQIYLNKVLIEINGNLEMVICKNKSDSMRLYNKIQEECEKKKYKYIAFMGDIANSKYKVNWIERIIKLTNWNRTKVERISTRE